MKKLVFLFVAAMLAMSASAQVVTSRTLVKSKSNTMWYARVGMSINNIAGFHDETDGYESLSIGSKIGMDVDFGFQRNIGKSGLYWGMELGIGTRGASFTLEDTYYDEKADMDYTAWNVKYSPFTIGYKYSLTDALKLDGHLGAFVSYDFTKKWEDVDGDDMFDYFDYTDVDAGIQVGIGLWWNKINLDFMYQRGFVKAFEQYYDGKDHGLKSSNFEIRLGYAF